MILRALYLFLIIISPVLILTVFEFFAYRAERKIKREYGLVWLDYG